jgi:hypothetical protein
MSQSTRRQRGWEARLHALERRAQGRTYCLGEWDCAIFAAQAVEALTGRRPAELAGLYHSKAGALRVQRKYGHTLAEAVSAGLGIPANPPKHARRGDILLRIDAEGVEHLGVCIGDKGLTLHPEGLNRRPLGDFAAAWRIG